LFKVKAFKNFHHRHIADILRIKILNNKEVGPKNNYSRWPTTNIMKGGTL